jgi:hypothetical protein
VKDQRDLAVISLDWGFNEQLCYLCTEQPLLEPLLWSEQLPPVNPMCLYLVHPPEYATFGNGMEFYRELKRAHPHKVSVRPYTDRQGRVAFYAIRLLK